MRILFIIPSLEAGGAERVVVRLSEYLVQAGNLVWIGIRRRDEQPYPTHSSVKVVELGDLLAPEITAFCQQELIDVVSDHYHWSMDHLLEIEKVGKVGIKVILTEHNSFFFPLFAYKASGDIAMLRIYQERERIYRSFAAVTALHRYAADLLSAISDRVIMVHNPVSYDHSGVSAHRGGRVVTVSGFHKPAKRMDLMLAFIRELRLLNPDAVLRIVGQYDEPTLERHLDAACLTRDAVELTGRTENVIEHYLASDLFVMTSQIEGQPMAMLEASSHGLPLLSFRIGGLEDQLIEGETGFTVPFGDVAGLAQKADFLLRDRERRVTMGMAGRNLVHSDFSHEAVGRQWVQILRAVVTENLTAVRHAVRNYGGAQTVNLAGDFNYWMREITSGPELVYVSVIVPTYGTEPYLRRCLESLIYQTLKNIEIIVVDDCSKGNCREIVEEFSHRDPRVRYVRHSVNQGLYQARSTGARIARGRYLAHVDSDDYVDVDMMRVLYQAAVASGADIAECQGVEVNPDGTRGRVSNLPAGVYTQKQTRDYFFSGQLRHVVWNKLYKKVFWLACAQHMDIERRITITEDLLRNVFLVPAARTYVFVDRPLYYYIRRETSVTRGTSADTLPSKLEDLMFVYDAVEGSMREMGIWEEYRSEIQMRRASDMEWYVRRSYNIDMTAEQKAVLRDGRN